MKIVCDARTEFKSKTMIDFCSLMTIKLHFPTTNNPFSNLPIEKFYSTITEKLRRAKFKNHLEMPENLIISVEF